MAQSPEQGWGVNSPTGSHEKLGLLWRAAVYKLISADLNNCPSFSCDPVGKFISPPLPESLDPVVNFVPVLSSSRLYITSIH